MNKFNYMKTKYHIQHHNYYNLFNFDLIWMRNHCCLANCFNYSIILSFSSNYLSYSAVFYSSQLSNNYYASLTASNLALMIFHQFMLIIILIILQDINNTHQLLLIQPFIIMIKFLIYEFNDLKFRYFVI